MFLTLMAFGLGYGQAVPASAKADFATRFPNATDAKWEKEGKLFEAHFKENGNGTSVEYDLQGKWMTTERRIPASEIPAKIAESLKAKYPTATFVAAETVQKGTAAMQYEVMVKDKGKMMEILTDASGKVLKTVHEKANGSGGEGGSGSGEDKKGAEGSAEDK